MADKRCICDDDQRGTAASPLKIRLPFSTRGEQEVNKKERQVEDIFFSFSLLQLVGFFLIVGGGWLLPIPQKT